MYLKLLKSTLSKLVQTFCSPEGWVFKAILAIGMFYAPIKLYVVAVLAMLVIDTLTGIWAAIVTGGRTAFKSKMLWHGLRSKLFAYFLLLTMSLFLDKQFMSVLGNETFYLTFFLSALISFYESSSIVENLIKINPDYVFLKRFTLLIDKLIAKQEQQIESGFDLKIGDKDKKEEGEVKTS